MKRRSLAFLVVTTSLAAGTPASAAPNQPPYREPSAQTPPATRPAAEFGFSPDTPQEQHSLPDINRQIALDAADLIKAKRFQEAAAVLDTADRHIREFAAASRMELWDSTIAPLMRLIDLRRAMLAREQAATRPAGATAPAAPRLTPDQNRLLAEIRSNLQGVSVQIRQNQLASAEQSLAAAQARLEQLVRTTRVPVWSVPLASVFQLADTRRSELKEKQAAAREAAREAARQKAAAAAARPQEQELTDDPNPDSGLPVGMPAPPFAAVTLEGKPFTTRQFRGKYVLIDFWATWCGPCRAEIPHLRAACEAYAADKRLVILSLSTDSQIAAPAQFVAKNNMPWMQGFLGDDSPVAEAYNVTGIPTILLVGPDGRVAANNMRGPSIKQRLARFLGPPTPTPAPAADQ